MRCAGEARWAIAPCACVVRNRLAGGWNETHVLDAFFAVDLPATATEIDLAQRVLTGAWPCDDSLWFMFSGDDVALIGLDPATAILAAARGEGVAYFYDKGALSD